MRFLRTSMKIGTLLEDILKTFSDMEPPEIWPSLLKAAIFQNGGKIQEFSVLSCISSQKILNCVKFSYPHMKYHIKNMFQVWNHLRFGPIYWRQPFLKKDSKYKKKEFTCNQNTKKKQ